MVHVRRFPSVPVESDMLCYDWQRDVGRNIAADGEGDEQRSISDSVWSVEGNGGLQYLQK